MLKKHFWKIALLIAAVLIGGAFYYSNEAAKEANEGVKIETHIKGNPDAKVVLVEYSDFQCPACGQFYPYVKDLMEEYGDQIRFEYRHFPLINIHPLATPAAKAAEAAAQQGKFWEMHDKLFENQAAWSRSSNAQALFRQYAEEIDLDLDRYQRQIDSSVIADAIGQSFEEARSRGFTGTPTFLLNDKTMEFSTFDEFRTQIEAAIGSSTPITE